MNTQDTSSLPPPAVEAVRPGEPATDAPRTAEGWLERLKAIVGLRAGSLRTDLAEVLAEGEVGKAEFSPAERTMLQNILGLEQRRIGDLMVPRADIVAVHKDIPIGELLKVFASAEHSRLVVYDDTLDDPTGMVHIRDLVSYLTERAMSSPELARGNKSLTADLVPRAIDLAEPLSATQIVRRILFVPASMPVVDLLVKMQATRIHLALVVDEYGGTAGLVTMEDVVETLIGTEIVDEADGARDMQELARKKWERRARDTGILVHLPRAEVTPAGAEQAKAEQAKAEQAEAEQAEAEQAKAEQTPPS